MLDECGQRVGLEIGRAVEDDRADLWPLRRIPTLEIDTKVRIIRIGEDREETAPGFIGR